MAPELMNPDLDYVDCGNDEDDEESVKLSTTPMSDVYSFGMTMLEVSRPFPSACQLLDLR